MSFTTIKSLSEKGSDPLRRGKKNNEIDSPPKGQAPFRRGARSKLRRFHQDEEGLEAVQTVMIVAIAAVILIAVMTLGQEVFDWLREKWDDLRGKNIS